MDAVTPQAEFTIEFSRPMDPESALRPLEWDPPIAANYRWDDEHTHLTFSAQRGFAPGRTYTLWLSPELRTAEGEAFDKPLGWTFSLPMSPVVSERKAEPIDEIGRQFRYRLTFSMAMDTASVLEALTVTPDVRLSTEWTDRTLVVETLDVLEPGVAYRFEIGTSAKSVEGGLFHSTYSWTQTMPALVSRVRTPGPEGADVPLLIEFNYPIDIEALEASLRFTPSVTGTLTYDERGHRLSFRPDPPLPLETSYTLSVEGDVKDPKGRSLGSLDRVGFRTPPAIVSMTPGDTAGAPITSEVTLVFARKMDRASVEDAFTLEPATEGEFLWRGSSLVFRPSGGFLQPETNYVVSVEAGIRDATGQVVLTRPWSRSFITLERQPLASFRYDVEVLIAEPWEPVGIPYSRDSSQEIAVRFDVYRLTDAQFAQRYTRRYHSRQAGVSEISWAGAPLAATWEEPSRRCSSFYGCSWEAELEGLPAGFYLVNLVTQEIEAQRFLIVTGEFITVKSYGGQVLAWVTTREGRPVADADIRVFTADGQLAAEGDTDHDGLFETWVFGASPPVLVLSQAGPETSAVGIEWAWSAASYGCSSWRVSDHETIEDDSLDTLVHIHTDRPIYRPGDTVHFKAVVRRDQDALLDLPDLSAPVAVRILDGRNNVLQTAELEFSRFGTVSGDFQLTEGAMLGPYTIEVSLGQDLAEQIFKVEDYRKPDIDVTVASDAGRYLAGDKIYVTVEADYFFGQPVADARVIVRLFQMYDRWWGDFYTDQVPGGRTITTDDEGRATIEIRAPQVPDWWGNWRSSLSSLELGIEATVDDGSHQLVSGLAKVTVYSAGEDVTLETGGYFHRRGQTVPLQSEVRTIDGDPVEGRTLELTILRWRPYDWDQEEVFRAEAVTAANGRAVVDYVPEFPGWYEVKVIGQDAGRHEMEVEDWFYVQGVGSGRAEGWGLRVSSDRESYLPGDTAKLMIETEFAGTALLTMERASVRRQELLTLTPPVTVVEVPVRTDDVPNIFATVSVWAPPNEEGYGLERYGSLVTSSVELMVPAVGRRLDVRVTPDQETYQPGETATFRVEVTGPGGAPAPAELSLALVDEAIFRLSEDLSPAIFDTFYGPRAHRVATFDTFTIAQYLGGGDGCGGGGGDGGMASPRSDFPDTALWLPHVETGDDGVVEVQVVMPDSLTTWRLTVRAVALDSRVGETRQFVTTEQPLVIRPMLPRMLVVGDTAVIAASIHNGSSEVQEVRASLGTQGVSLRTASVQLITLEPGASQVVFWPILANRLGEATLVFRAQGDTEADAIELPLDVQPLATRDIDLQAGDFDGRLTATFDYPQDALADGELRIELSRTVAASLLDGLEDLTGFPYGCVEQTMSAVLPNAVIARAFAELGVSPPGFEESIAPKVHSGLARLYALQHFDGGWGWWFDDNSDDYQTAWVMLGLGLTREAGYPVDDGVIERGAEWLTGNLGGMDLRTRAFALYSLAVVGRSEPTWAAGLLERAEDLDPFSQAALALALDAGGDAQGAREVLDLLQESSVHEQGYVRYSIPWEDGEYNRKTMASDVRATALALSAFERLAEGSADLRGDMARWLMAQRKSFGWGTTNETAFAILGLTDHLVGIEAMSGSTSYIVRLNGEELASGELSLAEPDLSLEIPASRLKEGENTVQLTEDGPGRLFYMVRSEFRISRQELQEEGTIRVTRRYLHPATKRPLERIEAGQLVLVEVQVRLPDDLSYLIIEDHPPAGLEPLNEGLNTTSFSARPEDYYYYDSGDLFFWEEYGYNYKEIREGRVSFFVSSLSKGSHTFSYYARATTAGRYIAQPAEAWAMYDLESWGRSASVKLDVWEQPGRRSEGP
ncbi:MAG TPA: Ig-like domain-containing protein [Anaerolineales bacterium]|nr:Ig-like domain-containing protein [Anaerolineales bacterium]